MAELSAELNAVDDAPVLRDELEGYMFARQCLDERQQNKVRDRNEDFGTEALELFVTAPAAGALSAWRTKSDFPVGGLLNGLAGFGFKALSCYATIRRTELDEEPRVMRVIGRAGKVLLHSQISMMTRSIIEDDQ